MRVRQDGHLWVVPLPVTYAEWRHLHELAELRGITIEQLLREGLRLPPLDARQPTPERHLRVVQPEPVA
jgi:hypothetical protein